jgi:hypothetical protein
VQGLLFGLLLLLVLVLLIGWMTILWAVSRFRYLSTPKGGATKSHHARLVGWLRISSLWAAKPTRSLIYSTIYSVEHLFFPLLNKMYQYSILYYG